VNYPSFVKDYVDPLPKTEELELFRTWNEQRENSDKCADKTYQRIIEQFSPIVLHYVNKMRGYKVNRDDLIGEALMSLSVAAQKFDPSKGFRFATYAHFCINKDLLSYVAKNSFVTNMCSNRENKKAFFNYSRTHEVLSNRFPDESESEITKRAAKSIGISIDTLSALRSQMSSPYQSIHAPIGDNDFTLSDVIPSDGPDGSDSTIETDLRTKQYQIIKTAVDHLDDRSRAIFLEQILPSGDNRTSLTTLGERYDISAERVRQVRDDAHRKVSKSIIAMTKRNRLSPADLLST